MPNVNFKSIRPGDIATAALVASTVTLLGWFFGEPAGGVLAGLVLGLVAGTLRHVHLKRIDARATTFDGLVWDVEVNGVTVGSVADQNYAHIQREVLCSPEAYIAQFENILGVARRLMASAVIGVPMMAFWCAIVLALGWPETLASVVTDLHSAGAEDLIRLFSLAAKVILVMGATGMLFIVATPGVHYGFVDCFAERTAHRLRQDMGIAAQGNIVLVSQRDNTAHCLFRTA